MNWKKINVGVILNVLRKMEKNSLCIDDRYSIVYSDGKEELEIKYKRLENPKHD